MIKDYEDYANEAWCDYCKHRIGRKKANNELVIVSDGYDKYYLFDSFNCAKQFVRDHSKLMEGAGLHGVKITDRLQEKIRLTPMWSISRTSILIIKSIIAKEDRLENETKK